MGNGQIIVPGTAGLGDVLTGKTFSAGNNYGTSGTMPENGAVIITPGTAQQTIASGHHNGSGYVNGDANLIAPNIKQGITLFGVDGTLQAKNSASGTTTSSGTSNTFTTASGTLSVPRLVVTGLAFTPTAIFVWRSTTPVSAYSSAISSYPVYYVGYDGNTAHTISLDGTNAYVSSGTFALPVYATNTSYSWLAIA